MTNLFPRRALLGSAVTSLAGLTACTFAPRLALEIGEAPPLAADEGLALLSFRRFVKADCTDSHYPNFILAHADGSPTNFVWAEHPRHGGWQADPVRQNVIRYVQALKLKAGRHALVGYTYSRMGTYRSPRIAPFPFTVTAGQATYIGGLGISPEYSDESECITRDGTPFYFSDFNSDLPLFVERFPILATVKALDRSVMPREWPRGPQGFD